MLIAHLLSRSRVCAGAAVVLLLSACDTAKPDPNAEVSSQPQAPAPLQADPRVQVAEALIGAFYAFDSTAVDSLLRNAGRSRTDILGYQQWAEGGNYTVEQRYPCRVEGSQEVVCAVTVRDDIVRSLQLKEWVTDTFRLTFTNAVLTNVKTSSNDPPVVQSAFKWVRDSHPELYSGTGVCAATAGASQDMRMCARAVMQAFREYRQRTPQ